MTRSRTKLLEQQVNSILIEYDIYNNENFILPKSLHLCMIRVVDNTSTMEGEEQPSRRENIEDGVHVDFKKKKEERDGGEAIGGSKDKSLLVPAPSPFGRIGA